MQCQQNMQINSTIVQHKPPKIDIYLKVYFSGFQTCIDNHCQRL